MTTSNAPAFPQHHWSENKQTQGLGLTKREWFAGQALVGVLANPMAYKHLIENQHSKFLEDIRKLSYACADALLSEPLNAQEG